MHNYEKSVQWSKKFLYDTKPTAESLKKSITRLLNDIDEFKVQGEPLVEILIDTLLYTNSNFDEIVLNNPLTIIHVILTIIAFFCLDRRSPIYIQPVAAAEVS